MKTKPYHHGDLRAELIRVGLEHLARGPASLLSLREIARDAGVSPTAVYRHFPDKQALEAELCRAGGQQFGAAMAEAQSKAENRPGPRLVASGRAYVRFALANPSLFRLMMTTASREDPFTRDEANQSSGFLLLRRTIAELAGPDAGTNEQRLKAVHAWATVHGLAMLMLDGQIPANEAIIDGVLGDNLAL
jgi:AcrR family transcriptional regulator